MYLHITMRLLLILFSINFYNCYSEFKEPTLLISVLARNKAHTLPYFLSNLERLNYPKNRISLWIHSDHNFDNTIKILKLWTSLKLSEYHSIKTEFLEDASDYSGESGPAHWTPQRFKNVISLRESSLNYARSIWADYYLALDSDVFLTNPDTLLYLVSKNFTVAAPMLKSDGLYSNFWYGMTNDYYYLRTNDYKPVLYRENTGCFNVPMVHTCVLINLRKTESDLLTYVPGKVRDFIGPEDDIITFAVGARMNNILLHVCNEEKFGYVMTPLEKDDTFEMDFVQMSNIILDALNEDIGGIYVNDLLKPLTNLPHKDTLGFDKVFMINLLRRPERKRRMMRCFDELGMDVTTLDAVDGRALNDTFLNSIKFMPDFVDPYHKRPMTLGEIGCFLSHYNVWKEVVLKSYKTSLILEDDIKFEPFFRMKVQNLLTELKSLHDWDLVYFGRKRLQENEEPWVDGSNLLVKAGYSYWTLGYALSLRGAKKLLDGDPLTKLVPVDEYLPILFDRHPQENYKKYFPHRNLVALSAAPLLLYPTHYTGETGYISDTEDSKTINNALPIDKVREDL